MDLSPFISLLDSCLCISCFLSFFSSKFWYDFSLKHKGVYSTDITVLWTTVSVILFNIIVVDNNSICFKQIPVFNHGPWVYEVLFTFWSVGHIVTTWITRNCFMCYSSDTMFVTVFYQMCMAIFPFMLYVFLL